MFYPYENPVNLRHILDSPGPPGQAIMIKVIFLASSKNGEYNDTNIISWILVFQKTENFSAFFFLCELLPFLQRKLAKNCLYNAQNRRQLKLHALDVN